MLWVVDELMTFKASAEHTGGAYSLTDSVVPSGGGPPPSRSPPRARSFLGARGRTGGSGG